LAAGPTGDVALHQSIHLRSSPYFGNITSCLYSPQFCGNAFRRATAPRGRAVDSIVSLVVVSLQEGSAMQLTEKHREYWNKNLRITGILLFIWFLVTFVLCYYARELSFNFFGWPFAFYMAAQGSLIIYVIIIWYYARYMNNLDLEYDVHEGEDD
jgi:putative solute:sodium symporter small subunit